MQKRVSVQIGIVFLIVLLLPTVFASYADIYIDVNEQGQTTITGLTNTKELITENSEFYTSKEQEKWFFELETKDIYENAVYELHLPEHAAIRYIDSSIPIQILVENHHPVVLGSGSNDTLRIKVQYTIHEEEQKTSLIWYWFIGVIVAVAIGLLVFFFLKKKKAKQKIAAYLPKRQKQIVQLLQKKSPQTLTALNEKLGIPKSSLTRNIASLERRNIIKKTPSGMSVLVELIEKKE